MYVCTKPCKRIPPPYHPLGKSKFFESRCAYMIFLLHRAARRGSDPQNLGSSHFQFFSPINVFFGLNFKIGELRPKIALFKLYLLEPEGPRAEITSLPSTNIGQLLTKNGRDRPPPSYRWDCTYIARFSLWSNKAKKTLFRVYLPEI